MTSDPFNQPESDAPQSMCERCHQPFAGWTVFDRPAGLCPGCHNAVLAERRAAFKAEQDFVREQEWQRLCPALYRQCQPEHLPSKESRAALASALTWSPEQGGLGLTGRDSGRGKTRIAFAALRPHFLAGSNVKPVLSGQFAVECAGKYDNQLDDWITPLRGVRLLLLDDLGKDRPTDRINAALFNLIEYRCAHQLPFVFTTNYAGDELSARFGDHGPYIVRRLREFCRTIVL